MAASTVDLIPHDQSLEHYSHVNLLTSLPRGAMNAESKMCRTGLETRLASRSGAFSSITSGHAGGFLQASPVILPSRYARDFRLLCARNPVTCPLLAESGGPGRIQQMVSHIPGVSGQQLASDLDIRRDIPRYMVYQNGKVLKDACKNIMEEWNDDYVFFLIGCSYSFETALSNAGLPPPHVVMNYNCPMYRTRIPLNPAGAFSDSTMVVSMRTYKLVDIERIRAITRPFLFTHGEPVAWGWASFKKLGIENIDRPEWGDSPLTRQGTSLESVFGDEENVPVFWGCGVKPQEAVMKAKLPEKVMCHCPGHVLILDVHDSTVMNIDI